MKKDISNKEDIVRLVNQFYDKAIPDPDIGFFFTEVAKTDMSRHLETMYLFWENVLFHKGGYTGNPMMVHDSLHKKSPFKMEHFQKWTTMFNETVDGLYKGKNADLLKQRASNIATIMQIKLFNK